MHILQSASWHECKLATQHATARASSEPEPGLARPFKKQRHCRRTFVRKGLESVRYKNEAALSSAHEELELEETDLAQLRSQAMAFSEEDCCVVVPMGIKLAIESALGACAAQMLTLQVWCGVGLGLVLVSFAITWFPWWSRGGCVRQQLLESLRQRWQFCASLCRVLCPLRWLRK